MKRSYLLTLFLLGWGFPTNPYVYLYSQYGKTAKAISYPQKKLPLPLQLTASIIDQKYCKGDAELDGVRLHLRLRFTNNGERPLILYKGSSIVSRQMISRNGDDAAVRRFEVESWITTVTDGSRVKIKGASPGKMFAILQPGELFETSTITRVFVSRDESRQISGAVKAGEHVLQIEIPVWPESDDLAIKMRQQWLQNGYLWSVPVVSQPMLFSVAEQRKLEDCN